MTRRRAPAARRGLVDYVEDGTAVLAAERDAGADLIAGLRKAHPSLARAVASGQNLTAARRAVLAALDRVDRDLAHGRPPMHVLERATVEESVVALRTIFAPVNERAVGYSALRLLRRVLRGEAAPGEAAPGFLAEFVHLFRGAAGKAAIYKVSFAGSGYDPSVVDEERLRRERTENLDALAFVLRKFFRKYPSGLEEDVRTWRAENRRRILARLGGTESDWNDPGWQLAHGVRDLAVLESLIELGAGEREAIRRALERGIPFGVTPYYLSLIDHRLDIGFDRALRAQVFPPRDFVEAMSRPRGGRACAFDFMGERETSPVPLVTRRYPAIAILKPFNTCAQICVYCQRNWQIEDIGSPAAEADPADLERALAWIAGHAAIGDVLVTGGDPLLLSDDKLESLLTRIAAIPHVYRIRLGTRTPVVLPMRWNDRLVDRLARFRAPGLREIAVVTHVQHPYEITPEFVACVERLRLRGIPVYNQQVFTTDNSRRFETARLRQLLRLAGVDPYYTFNMKGKTEMERYRVPVARILQERKEEARLMPGLDRTDEPVFNVPRLGKNHLRAANDRRLVSIRPDGARVYEFQAWEKNIAIVPTYLFTDVPIHDYLERLAERGEHPRDYRTIWYYR